MPRKSHITLAAAIFLVVLIIYPINPKARHRAFMEVHETLLTGLKRTYQKGGDTYPLKELYYEI